MKYKYYYGKEIEQRGKNEGDKACCTLQSQSIYLKFVKNLSVGDGESCSCKFLQYTYLNYAFFYMYSKASEKMFS